jgi:tetratricopeptide (TPR) repeat protein
MVVSNVDRDPIEELAEEFIRRRRIGEKVSIAEYAQNHPQWAERIHELFPAILWMEEWKPEADRPPSAASFELGTPVHALKRLGDYRIVRELGRGGMGVVYEAEQESLGRRVALKVLPAAALLSPNRLRRFHREARAAARLHHTNIVPIFGVGEQDGLHYYVMQLIPGQGLDRVLAAMEPLPKDALTGQSIATTCCDGSDAAAEPVSAAEVARRLLAGRFSPEVDVSAAPDAEDSVRLSRPFPLAADAPYWQTVAHIGLQTADALSYAHQRGTLHRDIKPANLLLDAKGMVWVADFGLAKLAEPEELTHSGDVVGTLRYMAPEQFEGRADARSDVYGLGLSLYEMLTLRPAFDGPHPCHTGQDRKDPPRPRRVNGAIPRDLETVVLKAIAPDPDHRYQTAGELADDLKRFLEDRPVLARRTSPPVRLWRWCRRNRAVAALTGTALALLAAVAVVASIGYFHVSRALDRVSEERSRADAARLQAEDERARTATEHQRAEANLALATRAFEDLFGKIAAEPFAPPDEEDDQWAVENIVTGKDAALLEGMLKFYDQFAQQNRACVSLQRETARAYRRVGNIQEHLGQSEKAETAYRRALTAYQNLAEAGLAADDSGTTMAAIHNDLGNLLRSGDRRAESRNAHQEALEILKGIPAERAQRPESRFELARTYSFLSSSLPARHLGRRRGHGGTRPAQQPPTGRLLEAEENNHRALDLLKKLDEECPANPRYRLATARAERDRSMIATAIGRKEDSDKSRTEAIAILEKLVAELPNTPECRYELAETYAMWTADGPHGDANGQLRRAIELSSDLATRYPSVPKYRASLARSRFRLAEALRSDGSLAEAESQCRQAVDLEKSLASEFANLSGYRFQWVWGLDRLAEIQSAAKKPAAARESLQEAIATLKSLQDSDARPSVRMTLALQYANLARVLRQLGETTQAAEAAANSAIR